MRSLSNAIVDHLKQADGPQRHTTIAEALNATPDDVLDSLDRIAVNGWVEDTTGSDGARYWQLTR